MAGHIPILRTGGDSIVRAGAARTQPGLEAAAVTAQLPSVPVPRRPFALWTPPGPGDARPRAEPGDRARKGPTWPLPPQPQP